MRVMRKTVWALALAAGAVGARAQEGRTSTDAAQQAGTAAGRAADTGARGSQLADRCAALIRGELAPAARADLAPRCEDLLRAGGSGGPAPATGRDQPGPGESVRTAFTNAGRELTGQRPTAMGSTRRGDVRNTLVTNPIGWFSGLGVNLEYERPLDRFDRVSWVAAARYARANATNGQVTSFGLGGGADLFIFGHNNEGLRIGPRIELALGDENIQGSTTFARVGLSGELGYNFIASSGLTAEAAVGVGGRLAGDSKNESFTSFTGGDLGPYLKVGLGWSW
jgi:hypothetical protein